MLQDFSLCSLSVTLELQPSLCLVTGKGELEAVGVREADSDPTAGWLARAPQLSSWPHSPAEGNSPFTTCKGCQEGRKVGPREGNAFSVSAEMDGEQQRILHVLVLEVGAGEF